jgi:hypothetical protein
LADPGLPALGEHWDFLSWIFRLHLAPFGWEITSNKTHFISVTVDGVKHYVNQYHTPKPSSTPKLTVAFQMDGNKYMTNYTWLDKVKLTYW